MDIPEHQIPHTTRRRHLTAVTLVVGALAAAACVCAAAYVVVKNLGRMTPVKSDVTLADHRADSTLSVFHKTMLRRTAMLSARFSRARSGMAAALPERDSLVAACESGFVRLGSRLVRLESLDLRARSGLADTIRMEYASLKQAVAAVARSAAAVAGPETDSLDAEFKKLVSE